MTQITATVNSQPITASVNASGGISASVGSSVVTATASGGIGPQGPSGSDGEAGSGGSTTDASLLTSGTLSAARLPASVVLTSDSRLSDARTPTAHSHAVSDVTGLQTSLDSKQAAGSYAAASHTHTAGQVSGLATVATSGSYADLANKPTIPDAVTSLPAASITGLATVATSGSYADLTNKPTIPAATTSASDLIGGSLSQARLDFVPIHPFLLMGG